MSAYKEGYLTKLSGFIFKTWEQRWFKLDGDQLSYYKAKQEADDDLPARATFDLKGATVDRAAEGKVGAPTAFCMEITVKTLDTTTTETATKAQTKSYFMCTETEKDLMQWMRAIYDGVHGSGGDEYVAGIFTDTEGWSGSGSLKTMSFDALEDDDDEPDVPPTEMDPNAQLVLRYVYPKEDDIMNTPHKLIKTGSLQEFEPSTGTKSDRQLLLFNDILLMTEKHFQGYYNIKVHISLSGSPDVVVSEQSPSEFQIKTHTGRVFILFAKTREDRDAWARAVAKQVAKCSKGRKSLRSSDLRDSGFSSDSVTIDDL